MPAPDMVSLLRARVLDPRTAALLWLLIDGGVPLVVAGPTADRQRTELAEALLSIDPRRSWVLLDATNDAISTERLAGSLRGSASLGITVGAGRLEEVLERLAGAGLPEDAVRRLGVVVIAGETAAGLRCRVIHYLRPTERDAEGHIQRRPPAILSAWDEATDAHEDYAWGITPELADRVDRSQADLEERQADRAHFLTSLVPGGAPLDAGRVTDYLATEPPRVPAPEHPRAQPSPFRGGLTDPH